MSPNGLLVFLALVFISLFTPTRLVYPIFGGVLIILYLAVHGLKGASVAFYKAIVLSAPLFVFIYLVWGVYMDTSPDTVLFAPSGIRLSAQEYALGIGLRIFLIVLVITGSVGIFSRNSSLLFIRDLWAPPRVKALLLMTLSLKNTIAIAANRSYTALVAANVLTPGISFKNLVGFWRLLQTVWVASLGIALERLDTKWKYEKLPSLEALNNSNTPSRLEWVDVIWGVCGIIAIVLTAITGLEG